MASIVPLIRVYRSGVELFAAVADSVTINNSLNESRESDVMLSGYRGIEIVYTDTVEVILGADTYGPYSISTIEREAKGERMVTSLTLAGCGEAYRNAATPDDDPFSATSNLSAFLKLPGFVAAKTGAVIPISFVSAEALVMGGNFSVGSTNALDMLRSLCGATNNAFRFTDDCRIEVGRFGEDSGLFIRNRAARSQNGQYQAEVGAISVDASDTYSYLYVEGGTFKKTDGEDYNLGLGSRVVTTFDLTPPDGYTISTDAVEKKLFYRLSRDAATVKRGKRIQIGGITPVDDTQVSEEVAANTLMNVAAKYLEAKAEPETSLTAKIGGYVRVTPGSVAEVFISSGDNTVLTGNFYIISAAYTLDGRKSETELQLSSRLTDPEDLLQATSPKLGGTGAKPHQGSGVSGVTIAATVSPADTACGGTGREVIIDYSVYGFLAVPEIAFECPDGVTASVTSSSATEATVCISKDYWSADVAIVAVVSGPLPV